FASAFDAVRSHWQVESSAVHYRGAGGRLSNLARRAAESDISQLRGLDARQYGHVLREVDYPTLVRASVCWVAVDGERIVGSTLVAELSDWACLSSLWVEPARRREGFAQALMGTVLHRCEIDGRTLTLN